MDKHQDDEMLVDPVSHEEKTPTTATLPSEEEEEASAITSRSLEHEKETSTTSIQSSDQREEGSIVSDRMSVDQDEETSVIASTSLNGDLSGLTDAIGSQAQSTRINDDDLPEFSDDENDFMREVRRRVVAAEAAQEEQAMHQGVQVEDSELDSSFTSHVTVVEALLLSQLEISVSDRFQMLSIVEHLVATVAADQYAPTLEEIQHNVDTCAFVKLSKSKKASGADGVDDSLEQIPPHAACAHCQHDPAVNEPALTLSSCDNCKAVQYCGIKCQLQDWKAHKNIYCVNPTNIPVDVLGKPHKAHFLRTTIVNPFARLSKGIWLHDRHKQDVYVLLIDSFRLREYDDYTFGGTSNPDSVYSGRPSSCPAFRRFVYQAEAKGLMPPWWSDQKRVECLAKGVDRSDDNWHDLHAMARDVEVVVVYEAAIMAMQLRMFAETVLGTGAAGTDGRLMLQHMVVIEEAARQIVAMEARVLAALEAEEKAAEE
ncbi:hypothetical protein J3F83DRAFT_772160 [Trichoderma novae-zelandiae]